MVLYRSRACEEEPKAGESPRTFFMVSRFIGDRFVEVAENHRDGSCCMLKELRAGQRVWGGLFMIGTL